MKKIFILLLSLGSLSTVFAQSNRYDGNPGGYSQSNDDHRDRDYRSTGYDNRNGSYDNRNNGYDNRNGGYDNRNSAPYDNRNVRNDRQRQQEIDRVNRDYDSRIDNYRRDRSISQYERNRRINDLERERSSKIKSFAGGLILGGVLGVILSH